MRMPLLSDAMLNCVYREDVPGIKKLLASGESPDAQDKDGRTALMHAILATPPSTEVISMLIDAGANINVKDHGQGWAALAFAARDRSAVICDMLLKAGAEIDASDSFGNTALWRAVMAKNAETVTLLIASGANPECNNKGGVSPRSLSETLGWTLPSVG
jgi:ankyrin repeat protein